MERMHNFRFGNRVLRERNEGENHDEGCASKTANQGVMSCENWHLFEEFLGFCESKNINVHNRGVQGSNGACDAEAKFVAESSSFREDMIMLFGDKLPASVFDDLCKLVTASTQGKCRLCKLPAEKLVFGVLQILSDAAQISVESKENVEPPAAVVSHVADMHVNSVGRNGSMHCVQQQRRNSIGQRNHHSFVGAKMSISTQVNDHNARGAHTNSAGKDFPLHCGQMYTVPSSHGVVRSQNQDCNAVQNLTHASFRISSEPEFTNGGADFLQFLEMNKQALVLDTPLVMCQANRMFHEAASIGNAPDRNKKSRVEAFGNQRHNFGKTLVNNPFAAQKASVQPQGSDTVMPVIVLSDDKTKIGGTSHGIRVGPGERFPVSEEDFRYYNIICGLGHSQWSGYKAVEFSVLTSVTYGSLGESVEPGGKADNFFVAGMCRFFFEDVHPRQSKKHFFYPKVGACLYSYSSPYDINTVEKSFNGANSAYKLHLSHKLCFPVCMGKHWFLFLVDLKNKLFVFLDSLFDSSSNFQKEASGKLINSFKVCWHQHAEGEKSLDDFSVYYPEVPKQSNLADCGIFTVKFMELWDKDVDLRAVFDQSDIPNIRVNLAMSMFFSAANTIDKSVVLGLYKQAMISRGTN